MSTDQHLDHFLRRWPFEPDALGVRILKGEDGRDVIQVRIDLGILQLETNGRPDGKQPHGFDSLLDYAKHHELKDPDFQLDDETCAAIDNEFVQYYHRRVSWLRLNRFQRAVQDADHTLELMDFCREHSPCEEWTFQHEQHRAFVLFHRAQAAALEAIEESDPNAAIAAVNEGLELIAENFADLGWDDQYETDELVERLTQLRESLRKDFSIEESLQDQLDKAVESEQYELAAQLRDEIAQRTQVE